MNHIFWDITESCRNCFKGNKRFWRNLIAQRHPRFIWGLKIYDFKTFVQLFKQNDVNSITKQSVSNHCNIQFQYQQAENGASSEAQIILRGLDVFDEKVQSFLSAHFRKIGLCEGRIWINFKFWTDAPIVSCYSCIDNCFSSMNFHNRI